MTNGAVIAAAAAERKRKALGGIICLEIDEFKKYAEKSGENLILYREPKTFSRKFKYITYYKGFLFYSTSKNKVNFIPQIEILKVKSIWIPD
jgi:hypothetical protein